MILKKHFTDEEIQDAKKWVKDIPQQLKVDRETDWTGHLGEKMFGWHLFYTFKLTYRKDFEWVSRYQPKSIDYWVKSNRIDVKTIARTVDPTPKYACNVCKRQVERMKQLDDTDYLVFVSYNLKTNVAELCGFISFDKFLEVAKPEPEGTVRNKMTVNTDMYECLIKQLDKEYDKLWKGGDTQ